MRIVSGIALTLTLAAVLRAQTPTAITPSNEGAAARVSDSTTAPDARTPEQAQPEAQVITDPAKPASGILLPLPSPQDVSEAKKLFKAGVKLKSAGKTEAAFEKFELAARLDPRSVETKRCRRKTRLPPQPISGRRSSTIPQMNSHGSG